MKRVLDVFLSLIILLLLFPILIVVAILIRFKLGAPIIFVQKRPGLNSHIFRMIKFRTMTNQTDKNGMLLPDEKRLTPFGMFLRKTSIDELPGLLM